MENPAALPEAVRELAKLYLEQIAALSARIAELEKKLRAAAVEDATARRLQTMPGCIGAGHGDGGRRLRPADGAFPQRARLRRLAGAGAIGGAKTGTAIAVTGPTSDMALQPPRRRVLDRRGAELLLELGDPGRRGR